MFKRAFSIFCLFFLIAFNAIAQGDPVLFTVGGKPTTVSEFKYIYSKTNQDKADFSEASLRDYLDLYVKFKLKVAKAREMQLDTIPSLQGELEGYRRQLAKSYLEDREVTEKLSREAYDRMVQDVDISHIFVACDKNAKPADTLKAYARINRILKLVQSGKDFGQVALDSTEDKVSKENRGRLGYLNAMLPDGFYTLERAIYSAKAGSIVGPIRSNTGYHIAYVHGFRPARGEMEVGQILFRKGDTEDSKMKARLRADSAYAELKAGAKWEDACQRWSDDKATMSKAGYIGFFGINRYQKSFEEAAFGLEKDGDYSLPVETTIGWHIIRRVSKRQVGAYDTMKKIIADRIKRDSRSELAKQSMIARIRKEGNYEEFSQNLTKWSGRQVDSIFHTFKWKPDPARPQEPLVRYGANKTYTVADFEDYCSKSGRERMRGAGMPVNETIQKLYKQWNDDIAFQFEETQLDKKYPEFKSLMREYEEGILLFEALKINVWDRANTDSVGLEQYFRQSLSNKYKWDERARVTTFTLKNTDPKLLADVREMAKKKSTADILKKVNKKEEVLTVSEKLVEKGKNKDLTDIWSAGSLTAAKTDDASKTTSFSKIEEIVAPTAKTLPEARGYAVADYQDYLEKQWIEDLRKAFPVSIDEKVLKSLVKK